MDPKDKKYSDEEIELLNDDDYIELLINSAELQDLCEDSNDSDDDDSRILKKFGY